VGYNDISFILVCRNSSFRVALVEKKLFVQGRVVVVKERRMHLERFFQSNCHGSGRRERENECK